MNRDKRKYVSLAVHIADKLFFKNMQFSLKQSALEDMEGINGWVLGYLYRHRETDIYQKNLETEFSVGKSTVTNIVKALEKAGYIQREDVPSDARLKKLSLTEAGIQKHLDVISTLEKTNENLVSDIDPAELDVFFSVLDRMKNNAEKMMGDTTCSKHWVLKSKSTKKSRY